MQARISALSFTEQGKIEGCWTKKEWATVW